jgi:hypothetical protein
MEILKHKKNFRIARISQKENIEKNKFNNKNKIIENQRSIKDHLNMEILSGKLN